MIYKFVFSCLILFSISCSKEETNTLIGTWLLIEQLADPGDGSGVFRKVVSDKTIDFLLDGTFVSNGSFCSLNTQGDLDSKGTYDSNGITPDDCQFNGMANKLEISTDFKRSELTIHFFCIEGCAQKYKKTN